MELKKIGLTFASFFLFFVLLNLMPFIPTEFGDQGAYYESKPCPLNYLFCMNSARGDNFPSLLKGEVFMFFIFPILLPVFFTILIYLKLIQKKF